MKTFSTSSTMKINSYLIMVQHIENVMYTKIKYGFIVVKVSKIHNHHYVFIVKNNSNMFY